MEGFHPSQDGLGICRGDDDNNDGNNIPQISSPQSEFYDQKDYFVILYS
jgi:hypothetical protein